MINPRFYKLTKDAVSFKSIEAGIDSGNDFFSGSVIRLAAVIHIENKTQYARLTFVTGQRLDVFNEDMTFFLGLFES